MAKSIEFVSAYAQEGKPVLPQIFSRQLRALRGYLDSEDAQGLTEYGAVLCFVSLLIALAFNFTNGSLGNAVLKSFSCITSQLNSMSSFAGSSS
jgi:Flp pilus assembly pilin Flp